MLLRLNGGSALLVFLYEGYNSFFLMDIYAARKLQNARVTVSEAVCLHSDVDEQTHLDLNLL